MKAPLINEAPTTQESTAEESSIQVPTSEASAVTGPYTKKRKTSSVDPFLGFDISAYPGNAAMTAWWNDSLLYFTGFYLAPAPNHSDTSWMSRQSFLANLGWGFAIIYVGRQVGSSELTYAHGQSDALNASSLTTSAGFPGSTTIFLDIETGGTLPNNMISYIQGWVHEIDSANTPYFAGVYCSYFQSAAQIKSAVGSDQITFWCFNVNCGPSPGCTLPSTPPSPASCGYSGASVWQYAQSPEPGGISCSGYTSGQCSKTFGGYTLHVDLDTASSANPSSG